MRRDQGQARQRQGEQGPDRVARELAAVEEERVDGGFADEFHNRIVALR